jgi:C4-dicarboxylate-specific signal transduction histidine kinase
MLGSMKPTDPFFPNVQEIMRSSSLTAALTQKLLAFGRKQLLTLRRVDLNAVVSGLEPALHAMLGRIRLEFHLDRGLAPTKADQDHLEEAILVLVRNALDPFSAPLHPRLDRVPVRCRQVAFPFSSPRFYALSAPPCCPAQLFSLRPDA